MMPAAFDKTQDIPFFLKVEDAIMENLQALSQAGVMIDNVK